ncbi:MAG: UDP-glucose/GDP-mannose dehydrogenase family protein [Planctomycetes bacterium]|nr:UDP-glucose/GDP-mannose dehydrogenase family protein [Planctomycetota bacterium]
MAATLPRISVFGLGKLGAPLAACLAHKGHEVIGVDVDPTKVEALKNHKAPVFETGLQEMLTSAAARIKATADAAAAVGQSEISCIVTATPSEPEGGFSLKFVLPVCEIIGRAIAKKKSYHLVVLNSTVMPGATGGPIREALEKASGMKAGKDFGLCYSPEFIALGSVIRDFLNPDFVLIGESDKRAGDLLQSVYDNVCNKPPAARMNFVNAELTKLSVNTFVTTKISYANMLAAICSRLPGADVDVVTEALGKDTRIGKKYLKGALGYGGPCFPRDNKAFAALGRKLEVPALLAEATDHTNDDVVRRLAGLIEHLSREKDVVGILGLSYKASTDVVEAAQGLLLAQTLVQDEYQVVVYDPAGMPNAKRVLKEGVRYAASAEDCMQQSDVLVIATPWDEFRALKPELVKKTGKPRAIIDGWRVLDAKAFSEVAEFVSLGKGPKG